MRGIFLFSSAILFVSCAIQRNQTSAIKEAAERHELKAVSDLHSVKLKDLKGYVWFEENKEGTLVRAKVSGLPAGKEFGFHIHDHGVCEGPDYKSAGGHFNPTNQQHGGLHTTYRHLGDMGNLLSDKSGIAHAIFTLPQGLEAFIGKAVIVHARRDDFANQPTGDSGDRIACGLIKPSDFTPER